MKAIILAGGFATRLGELGESSAKALIDVGGKPVIGYIIEKLEKVKDVDEIFVSTNAKFGEDLQKWTGRLQTKKKVSVVVENSLREGEKLGAIGGINFVLQAFDVDEDCLTISGDNIFGFELTDFVDYYRKKKTVINAVFDVKDKEQAKKLGIVVLRADRISDFVEKPENPPTTFASIGCYLFPKDTLPLFAKYLQEGNNKDAPGFFLQWLHKREPLYAYTFGSYWFDIGTQESLEAARKFMEKK